MKTVSRWSRLQCALLGLGMALFGTGVHGAQAAYPEKPITVLVGFAAGGGTDQVARFVCGMIEKDLHQPVVISNVPGASGARSLGEAAKARPDGYTVLFITSNLSTLRATGHTKLTHEYLRPVVAVNYDSPALIVRADSPYKTLEDFIAAAKEKPGKINIATGAPGGLWHFGILEMERAAGIKLNIIPATSGGAVAAVSLMGKHVEAICNPPNEAIPQLKSGEFRILASTSAERLADFPDVPTFREKGLDVVIASYRGFFVPKNTPDAVVNTLAQAIEKAAHSQEYRDFMKATFSNGTFMDPAAYTKYLEWELPAYTKLVKNAGLSR